ncbi:hypothetical protein [Marinospirillum insulare]|uniref:Uncharacterized protein n=1 Tax=Marinospirillum insulare TaxID=217169 RepID=A0ABQ5ZYN4_9GAMM|nr:hypothetical protein [Marinospirillum insulare]GLR64418.1 hypothetical protein GCM10007878_18560 [Marinospirillum insulare]
MDNSIFNFIFYSIFIVCILVVGFGVIKALVKGEDFVEPDPEVTKRFEKSLSSAFNDPFDR